MTPIASLRLARARDGPASARRATRLPLASLPAHPPSPTCLAAAAAARAVALLAVRLAVGLAAPRAAPAGRRARRCPS
eukprot:scaffold87717_cov30-Tisochrysis_lutea.AAC.1